MPFCAPQIVYSNSWVNNTVAIPLTTVFTPTSSGLFRVSLAGRIEDSANASSVVLQGWFDAPYDGSNSISFNIQLNTSPAPFGNSWVIECVSGNVMKIETSFTSFSPTFSFFDAYLTIEQLQ